MSRSTTRAGSPRIRSLQQLPLYENGGYFALRPEIFDHLPENGDLIGDACTPLAAQGRMLAYRHSGFWHPADTVKERTALEAYYRSGHCPWMLWEHKLSPRPAAVRDRRPRHHHRRRHRRARALTAPHALEGGSVADRSVVRDALVTRPEQTVTGRTRRDERHALFDQTASRRGAAYSRWAGATGRPSNSSSGRPVSSAFR